MKGWEKMGLNVADLIAMLEKVKTKTAPVFLEESQEGDALLERAIIEHDLADDEVVVVLKSHGG